MRIINSLLLVISFLFLSFSANSQCVNKGETIPVGDGTPTVTFNFTIDNTDDLWNFYNDYNHEVYCFTVDVTGAYDFSQPTGIGEFTCLLQGYDEDIDFYLAPNLLGTNFTQGGTFQANLTAGTTYYLLLKSRVGTVSNTATISGPGNIDFGIAPPPAVPTLGQWGLMTLGLIVLIFGIVAIRQRQVQLG